MAGLILRSQLTIPLSNAQLDNNFIYLKGLNDAKLNIIDFSAVSILDKLNSATSLRGVNSDLDVSKLRGYAPSAVNTPNSIVQRDSSGNFAANTIAANIFSGEATSAIHSKTTDKLKVAVKINNVNFDGSAAITIYDGTKLSLTGGTLTGKLIADVPNSANASITLPHGTQPATLVNGDMWTTTTGLFNVINGITKQVAFVDSNISGLSANVSGVVTIAHGGTGATDAATARVNLGVAPINSPAFSGNPTYSVVPPPTDNSATLSTNTWVQGALNNRLSNYPTNTAMANAIASSMPVPAGAVMAFAMSTPPARWLECNGRMLEAAAYPELFAAIGSTYGGVFVPPAGAPGERPLFEMFGFRGLGFAIPDLRGEFIRGWDHGRGIDANRQFGSSQLSTAIRLLLDKYAEGKGAASAYPDGTLAITGSNIDGFITPPTNDPSLMRYPGSGLVNVSSNNNYINASATYVRGSGDNVSFQTRSRNVAMMYCIKY